MNRTISRKCDYLIIGSGFGGSVAALRLAQKGYKVVIVEQGKRFNTEDFPKTNWSIKKAFWFPKIGLYGIQAMTLLKNVFILHGAGVGGGSLVYANNLLVPPENVLQNSGWGLPDPMESLLPFYQRAKKMLGAIQSPVIVEADEALKACAEDINRGHTFHVNDVGIYFGKPGETVPDPYFGGDGPDRTGCNLCGGCMVGCRNNAKNTLDKNYLYLAEKLGVEIIPETQAVDVKPNSQGYVTRLIQRKGFFKSSMTIKSENVVFAGGVMGTVKLLHQCKTKGSLPNISHQLGNFVRTNSEALVGIYSKNKNIDFSKGIAITSGVYPDDHTHIETVRYGKNQDAMSLLATPLTGGGPPWPRVIRFMGNIFRHPIRFIRSLYPFGWAERATILLVMQTIDNYMKFDYKRRWWRLGGKSMNSNWNTENKVPSYIPVANDFAMRMSEKLNGIPFSTLPEVLFNTSSTAHILGGCKISDSQENGVINSKGQIHNYSGLYVVDGSTIPVNLGVNPSLTITAISEYFMDQIPSK